MKQPNDVIADLRRKLALAQTMLLKEAERAEAAEAKLAALNAGEPQVTFSQGGTPAAHGASWERDPGEPGPRCPTDAEWLKLAQSLTNLYIVNKLVSPALQDKGTADFLKRELAQFFPAERQEGWAHNSGHKLDFDPSCGICREQASVGELLRRKAERDSLPAPPSAPETSKEK